MSNSLSISALQTAAAGPSQIAHSTTLEHAKRAVISHITLCYLFGVIANAICYTVLFFTQPVPLWVFGVIGLISCFSLVSVVWIFRLLPQGHLDQAFYILILNIMLLGGAGAILLGSTVIILGIGILLIISTIMLDSVALLVCISVSTLVVYIATWFVLYMSSYAPILSLLPPTLALSTEISIIAICLLTSSILTIMSRELFTSTLERAQQALSANEQLRQSESEGAQQISEQLNEQERLLSMVRTLEVPILPVQNDMIVVPLISYLDIHRLELIEQRVLGTLETLGSHFVILEMTGVPTIDERSATRLLQLSNAITLMGATTIITGMQPDIATQLVVLGIDTKKIKSYGTIQDVLDELVKDARVLNATR